MMGCPGEGVQPPTSPSQHFFVLAVSLVKALCPLPLLGILRARTGMADKHATKFLTCGLRIAYFFFWLRSRRHEIIN